MVTRISVSSLDAWQECRLRWYYQYKLGLRPAQVSPRSATLSGRAIHFGAETGILQHTGLAGAVKAAGEFLASFGEESERFMRGVEVALGGVPQEVWDVVNPQAELEMVVPVEVGIWSVPAVYGPSERVGWPATIDFVGRPDLWYVNDDGLFVVDFKSTSSDEQDRLERYQTYNMQPRYYAAMLREKLRRDGVEVPPTYFNHIVLSTRGKHAYGPPWPATPELLDMAWSRMLKAAREMVVAGPQTILGANIGTHCTWCDFNPIDVAILTGGDGEAVMAAQYKTREERH